jgi:hypothetical protein
MAYAGSGVTFSSNGEWRCGTPLKVCGNYSVKGFAFFPGPSARWLSLRFDLFEFLFQKSARFPLGVLGRGA